MSSFRTSFAVVYLAVGLLASSQLGATTYYVDYSSGSDNVAGTSTNAPWKHCPGDPTATGAAAAAALAPGDTVIFKGGVSYILTAPYQSAVGTPGISLKWDGATNNPITYDGNSAGTWGTGRAILTDNCGTNLINAFMKTPYADLNFVNFTGLEIGPVGGALVLPTDPTGLYPAGIPANPGGGIIGFGAFNNVTISGCYFHGIGYWFNQKPMGDFSIAGQGIVCHGCTGLTITNCQFTQISRAVQILISAPTLNLVVENCTFGSYTVWAIDLAVQSPTALIDGISIHNNNFNDIGLQYANGVWSGFSQGPHQDAIFFRADSVPSVNCGPNINVFNNDFRNTISSPGGTASIFLVGNTSMNIYNNVFAKNSAANGVITVNLSSTTVYYYLRVLNNTFYEDSSTTFYIGVGGNTINTNYFVQIENNICSQVVAGYNGWTYVFQGVFVPPASVYNIDYNCYVSSNWNNSAVGVWGGVLGYVTLPIMKAHGWEPHGFVKDPKFVNISDNNFHLQTNSPAILGGLNLSSLNIPGLINDKDGNPRPVQGSWTMGAYQAAGLAPVEIPGTPRNLHVLSNH